ncbi:MAG TPA: class I SAM-dependent methyltransferase [Chitinivibrionales bacterium]|nr:class I SAM-dependent methyltransferase [Chitinivibrionales bacterium]
MDRKEYVKMFSLEASHWWFAGMRHNYLQRVSKYFRPGDLILDVGMGTGIISLELRRVGLRSVGVDISKDALSYAKKRQGLVCVQAMGCSLPFCQHSFDGAVCFDTMEHVPDEIALLTSIRQALSPNGMLVISVPAHPFLFGAHDRALGHERRYSRWSLERALLKSGFSPVSIEWLNVTLFPPIALVRWIRRIYQGNRQLSKSDMSEIPDPLNSVLKTILAAEAGWTKLLPFLPGLSLLAVAQDRST